jgi:hypothetical protein
MLQFIDNLPTTRIRILVTIGLIVATVVTWLKHACDVRSAQGICLGWEPSANMIMFLAALAGVDVAQYLSRGFINRSETPAASQKVVEPATEPAVEFTTDVSELSEQEKG